MKDLPPDNQAQAAFTLDEIEKVIPKLKELTEDEIYPGEGDWEAEVRAQRKIAFNHAITEMRINLNKLFKKEE